MSIRFFSKKVFFCSLVLCLCVTAVAQHGYDIVTPGIDGQLPAFTPPEKPDTSIVACFELNSVISSCSVIFNGHPIINTDADFNFPQASQLGIDYYTLQFFDTNDNSWKDYLNYNDNPYTTSNNNFSVPLNFPELTKKFRLRFTGGIYDGRFSNEIEVSKPKKTTCRSQSSTQFFMNNYCNETLDGSCSFSLYYFDNYDDEVYIENVDENLKYSWYRRNPYTYEMTLIEGADSSSYTVTEAEIGYEIVEVIQGDDENFSLYYQISSPIIKYPITCSFDYYGDDGVILNTNYNIEDLESMLDITYAGEYDTITNICPIEHAEIQDIRKISDGQYAVYFDNLVNYNSYSLVSLNSCYAFTQRVKDFFDIGQDRIDELYTMPSYVTNFISTRLNNEPVLCDIEVFQENLDGELIEINHQDSITNDTIIMTLLNGKYYLKVQKNDDYETSYYQNGALWSEANSIDFSWNPVSFDSLYIFNLIPAIPSLPIGDGVIEGQVYFVDETKKAPTNQINNLDSTIYNVCLRDNDNKIVAWETTETDGTYRFSNLPIGEYEVLVDIVGEGLITSSHKVAITNDVKSVVGVDYIISPSGITATGIYLSVKEINQDDQTTDIFDLNGRKLNQIPANGLFIINGKVVYIKE